MNDSDAHYNREARHLMDQHANLIEEADSPSRDYSKTQNVRFEKFTLIKRGNLVFDAHSMTA